MSVPKVAVLDYGMGNLRSVCKALEAVGAAPSLVEEASGLAGMAGVVFPGQGALGDCVVALRRSGLADALRGWIAEDRPYLGICLGLQALFEHSEESGEAGLGMFPGQVLRFRLPRQYKIPHMGWNEVRFVRPNSPLCEGIPSSGAQFYFVHSYHVVPEDPDLALCLTDYGGDFVSGIERGNCRATQFHPEKSQAVGLQLYRNFVDCVARSSV